VVDDQEGARLLVASCIDAERAPASPAVTILTKNGELEAELGRELREIWRRIHPDEPPRTRD
jgi:hypothetical protein